MPVSANYRNLLCTDRTYTVTVDEKEILITMIFSEENCTCKKCVGCGVILSVVNLRTDVFTRTDRRLYGRDYFCSGCRRSNLHNLTLNTNITTNYGGQGFSYLTIDEALGRGTRNTDRMVGNNPEDAPSATAIWGTPSPTPLTVPVTFDMDSGPSWDDYARGMSESVPPPPPPSSSWSISESSPIPEGVADYAAQELRVLSDMTTTLRPTLADMTTSDAYRIVRGGRRNGSNSGRFHMVSTPGGTNSRDFLEYGPTSLEPSDES